MGSAQEDEVQDQPGDWKGAKKCEEDALWWMGDEVVACMR